MAKQIEERSLAGSRQSAVKVRSVGRLSAVFRLLRMFAVLVALTAPAILEAASLASKNKEGNRLFDRGKFEDAEKAYLEAQVKNPGRPEILYNLGNSLIKQKKYNEGIQALRQSVNKGDKKIRKDSWYNTGNALFSMGSFKDSAEAFIQALRLDPADSDAKHNLELALMKLKQQQQNQSSSNQKKQNSENSKPDQSSSGKNDGQQQPKQGGQSESAGRREQNKPAKAQTPQEVQREGRISREQATQILDAVQNQELEQQRKLLESRARRRTNRKDW